MIEDWRNNLPMIGRMDTNNGLKQFFEEDRYFDFKFLCKSRKIHVDRVWLKAFLIDRCRKNRSKVKYLGVYKMVFQI